MRELAAPAVSHLFDWLVTGQVEPVNPAGSVRGAGPGILWPRGERRGLIRPKRALLDSIDSGHTPGCATAR
jgi:hypothetical protein